jgi:hypothetical protein
MTERYSHVGTHQKRATIQLLTGESTPFGQYMVNEQNMTPDFVHIDPRSKQRK